MRVPDDYCRYLVMHAKSSERLLARTEGLTALDLEVSTSPEAMSLRRMVYAVMSEVHRMKAFVRLRPLGDRVLWGYMKPRHRIGEHTSEHFARRNADVPQKVGADDHVDARCDHSRGMNECRDRRGAGHGVGQPDVERNLRAFAGSAE